MEVHGHAKAWEYGEDNARGGEGRAGAIDYFLYIDARYFARVLSTSQRLLPLRSASSDLAPRRCCLPATRPPPPPGKSTSMSPLRVRRLPR
uniref:Uncharacterized protein n=1 Tax=Oryza sativa subsp. japonica TaxID=39947 RepID=Q67J08_ORYSJ|nr:hypothetical protein [Oryza sativa Japonica Group]